MAQDTTPAAKPKRFRRTKRTAIELPLIPLREMVIFPHMTVPVTVARSKSLLALEEAGKDKGQLFLVCQKNIADEPSPGDLYPVGTIVTLEQSLRMPDGTTQALVAGKIRAAVLEVTQTEPHFWARVRPVGDQARKTVEVQALMRLVLSQYETYINLSEDAPEDAIDSLRAIDEPGWLADMVSYSPHLDRTQRQMLLETLDPVQRLRMVSTILSKQIELLELKQKIQSEVHRGIDKSQREYHLREQMKAIQRELGELEPEAALSHEMRRKVEEAGMPEEVQAKALQEVERLAQVPSMSPEIAVIRNYLDWLVALPWSRETLDNLDLQQAARVLDEDHYGLAKVKERILEYIAVRKLTQKMRSPILCFVGPPGVGKTSLGRSIARALGRRFVRISLGGIRDEAEIRGHRRTYVGAMPGRVIQSMRTAGYKNPLFMLDEIDKVGVDFRGDPSAALLEVLDPEQNHAFSDHFLEMPFDLSRVIFITTANQLDPIPPALRDRMEVIELPGYTEEEKLGIARRFLVPKQLEQHGISDRLLCFSRESLVHIVRDYTDEAGVRNLEREIANVCRKAARRIAEGHIRIIVVGRKDLARYLGPPRFLHWVAEEQDEVGLATGLAWTPNGGEVLSVEVNLLEGKPDLILTGHLGDVMQESAQAALTYARSHAAELCIDAAAFEQNAIHIHVPAGAIPKDGPSAGITLATALVSALTGRPVRRDVAMTGEITLRGNVLPVGGIKEKLLAARRAGLTRVVLPRRNRKDLTELPGKPAEQLDLVLVENMSEVLRVALAGNAQPELLGGFRLAAASTGA
ncbi:MAG: endopeptidase La [Actinobacteria bacterium]|nr:endopeptidase La [Actinomycetota bacterium]MCL5025736.1 endopeptidase La [Chloroflexota bacterium]